MLFHLKFYFFNVLSNWVSTYAELMLLGFISFVLSLSEGFIVGICVSENAMHLMLPCKKETYQLSEGVKLCKKKVRDIHHYRILRIPFLGNENSIWLFFLQLFCGKLFLESGCLVLWCLKFHSGIQITHCCLAKPCANFVLQNCFNKHCNKTGLLCFRVKFPCYQWRHCISCTSSYLYLVWSMLCSVLQQYYLVERRYICIDKSLWYVTMLPLINLCLVKLCR